MNLIYIFGFYTSSTTDSNLADDISITLTSVIFYKLGIHSQTVLVNKILPPWSYRIVFYIKTVLPKSKLHLLCEELKQVCKGMLFEDTDYYTIAVVDIGCTFEIKSTGKNKQIIKY